MFSYCTLAEPPLAVKPAWRPRFNRALLRPAKVFYEHELGKLSRTGTSFSVNLDSGGFFCHGCGAKGGDITAFLAKRYGYSFREVAIDIWPSRITPTVADKLRACSG